MLVQDQTIDEGLTISVDGSGSSAHSSDPISLYEWDWTSDGTYDATGITATSPAYNDDGTFTVTLRVIDEDSTNTDTLTVTVNDLSPTAVLSGDTSLDEGQLGNYDASSSTSSPDAIVFYEWDWDYTGSFNPSGDVGDTQTHTWNDDGSYDVAVRVTDDDGSQDIDTLTITVDNFIPTFDNLDNTANTVVNELFEFDVDASDLSPSDTLTYGLISYPSGMVIIDANTGEIDWNPTSIGIYTINVSVTDGTDTIYGTLTVYVYDYMIELDKGWNLISIPLVPENDDTTVKTVFGDIADDVLIIWAYTYDPDEDKNVWTYHEINGSFNGAASLQNVVPGYGYYVKMADHEEHYYLYLNGEIDYQVGGEDNDPVMGMPPSVTLAMDSWNLIGVYGLNDIDVDDALVSLEDQDNDEYYDIIYDKDGDITDYLHTLEGYWLSVKKVFDHSNTIEYKANYDEDDYCGWFGCY